MTRDTQPLAEQKPPHLLNILLTDIPSRSETPSHDSFPLVANMWRVWDSERFRGRGDGEGGHLSVFGGGGFVDKTFAVISYLGLLRDLQWNGRFVSAKTGCRKGAKHGPRLAFAASP